MSTLFRVLAHLYRNDYSVTGASLANLLTGGLHANRLSSAWNSGVKIINEIISLLPNLFLAVLIFLAFPVLSAGGKSRARRWVQGTVDDIQSRATIVNTKDRRQVVMPNAVLFASPVAIASAAKKGSLK